MIETYPVKTSGEFEEKFQARNLTQIMNLPEEDAIVRVDGRKNVARKP
ncbi:MAG: hypothetical protein ACLU80_11440 [Dorea sp.]